MLQRLYDRIMELSRHRNASHVLAAVAFVESSVFPLPPDALLIPMTLAQPRRAYWYAAIATAFSVVGGLLGYAIGFFLFESVGTTILNAYGLLDKFEEFARNYNENGVAIVFFAGLTPFPYKVITIASGTTGLSLPVFIAASVVSRATRFFLVAALLWWFGEQIRGFIERYLPWITLAAGVLLVGGFLAVRYLL